MNLPKRLFADKPLESLGKLFGQPIFSENTDRISTIYKIYLSHVEFTIGDLINREEDQVTVKDLAFMRHLFIYYLMLKKYIDSDNKTDTVPNGNAQFNFEAFRKTHEALYRVFDECSKQGKLGTQHQWKYNVEDGTLSDMRKVNKLYSYEEGSKVCSGPGNREQIKLVNTIIRELEYKVRYALPYKWKNRKQKIILDSPDQNSCRVVAEPKPSSSDIMFEFLPVS